MKYKPGLIFLHILFTLLFSFSCTHNSKETTQLLNQVEHIIIQYPDSAFNLLETISPPDKWNASLYNRYHLLLIQAKDKQYEDIASDTFIYNVRDYYVAKNDYPNAALAQYYCGRVLHEQQNTEEATAAYLQAEQYAEHTDNDNLKGLIQYSLGAVLYEQSSKNDALNRYLSSLEYVKKTQNPKNEIIMYNLIGGCYLLKKEYDTALYNYTQALVLAEAIKDTIEWANTKHNMGCAFHLKGNLDKAKVCFHEALIFMPEEDFARTYMVMAKLFLEKEQQDSVHFYVEKVKEYPKEIKDSFLASLYDVQIQTEENQGNYREALRYAKEYIDIILDLYEDHRDQSVLDIQKKYDSELIKNENHLLQIQKQRTIGWFSIVVIVLLSIAMFFYWKYIQSKQKRLEAEQKIDQLMEMAEDFNKKEDSLKHIVLEHFEVLKKAALLEEYINKDKITKDSLLNSFNKIVYGQNQLDWEVLYCSINGLYDGLFDKLQVKYPDLADIEFRICYLTYVDFSRREISLLMNLSESSIQAYRASIRKKLGIESKGNIREFINKKVHSDK